LSDYQFKVPCRRKSKAPFTLESFFRKSLLKVVLCGSGFSSVSLVSVQFWIKTAVSVSISKPSQYCF